MSKKILFLPNDLGGGLGHVRRTLRLAEVLRRDNWQLGFLAHRKNTLKYFQNSDTIFYIPTSTEEWIYRLRKVFKPVHFRPQRKLPSEPYFWEFNSLNFQIYRDGYFTPASVWDRFRKLVKIINKWRPDVIVGDGHLLTFFLGKYCKIPVIQIVRYAVFPENQNFIWWKKRSNYRGSPPSSLAFKSLFEKVGENFASEANEFLQGDAYLIPGTPEIEPIVTKKSHLFFGYHIESNWDSRLLDIDTKKRQRKIYITIGGGSRRSHISEYYKVLIGTVKDLDAQIVFSDPHAVLHQKYNKQEYPNISVFKWIDSSTIFPYLNLVIHHGGYNTVLESLWWGVPSVIIPSHTEQEGNGRRLQLLKVGKIIPISNEPYQEIIFDSYYGKSSMFGGFEFNLTPELVISTIHEMLYKAEYTKSALIQSSKLKLQFNPDKILHFFRKNS